MSALADDHYPPTTRGRTAYLLFRFITLFFATLMLIAVSVAAGRLNQPSWLDPTLAPGITSFLYSLFDIISVVLGETRSFYLTRIFLDGLLAVGFPIAAGFLGRLAVPLMDGVARQRGDRDGEAVEAMGAVILTCMLIQMIIYGGVSFRAVRGWVSRRAAEGKGGEVEDKTGKV
ncbi:hypothetical protein OQA88_10966 [Cercophora sp. LCS_1]